VCGQLAQGCGTRVKLSGVEPATSWSLEEAGFHSIYAKTVLCRVRTNANSPVDCSRWQMTRAATLKLRLRSSVDVLGTVRYPRSAERRPTQPERFAVGMQTCWKYMGPAPRIQLNARNAILNCIRWGTGSQCTIWRSTGVTCLYLLL